MWENLFEHSTSKRKSIVCPAPYPSRPWLVVPSLDCRCFFSLSSVCVCVLKAPHRYKQDKNGGKGVSSIYKHRVHVHGSRDALAPEANTRVSSLSTKRLNCNLRPRSTLLHQSADKKNCRLVHYMLTDFCILDVSPTITDPHTCVRRTLFSHDLSNDFC